MSEVIDVRPTIVPKSDQLNADQLLEGPMIITVTAVHISASDEQPISIHYEGENGRPFKPCKTMRKLLVYTWGVDGRDWIGKSMTLYNDPDVKFGGAAVGGIRVSHLSDIEKDVAISLLSAKGKKALYSVKRMARPAVSKPALDERLASIVGDLELVATTQGTKAFKVAWNAVGEADRDHIGIGERDRLLGVAAKFDEQRRAMAAAGAPT